MFFFRRNQDIAPRKREPVSQQLAALVQQHMRDADAEDVEIATAIAGLLAGVAYADRQYRDEERARIRADLMRMQSLPPEGVSAICELLERDIVELGTTNPQRYTRSLRELVDVSLRREVLEVLVDLAAADGEISLSESDLLRRTASALGLTSDDYLAAQAKHSDRISILK